jgi:carbon-monoxide dehydrogenase medium subunit
MNNAHPGLPEFDYVKPGSLAEASQFLAEHAGRARPFLGGTDVFVRMRDGFWPSDYLVDVKNLDGTNDLRFDAVTGLTMGAGVNMNRVIASPVVAEHYPLLVEACRTVASLQLRSRATIAGNICNASPSGDTIGACLVLDAYLTVHGVDGFRKEPLATFFLGPGNTTLKAGDIVTSVVFPVPPPRSAGKYIKLGRNAVGDLAIVGVSVFGFPDPVKTSGYCFRIALASVAPVPLRAKEAEMILANKPINEGTIADAAQAAMEACNPIDDVRGSARYRKLMVRNLTRMAASQVFQQLTGQA